MLFIMLIRKTCNSMTSILLLKSLHAVQTLFRKIDFTGVIMMSYVYSLIQILSPRLNFTLGGPRFTLMIFGDCD